MVRCASCMLLGVLRCLLLVACCAFSGVCCFVVGCLEFGNCVLMLGRCLLCDVNRLLFGGGCGVWWLLFVIV